MGSRKLGAPQVEAGSQGPFGAARRCISSILSHQDAGGGSGDCSGCGRCAGCGRRCASSGPGAARTRKTNSRLAANLLLSLFALSLSWTPEEKKSPAMQAVDNNSGAGSSFPAEPSLAGAYSFTPKIRDFMAVSPEREWIPGAKLADFARLQVADCLADEDALAVSDALHSQGARVWEDFIAMAALGGCHPRHRHRPLRLVR